MGAREVEKVHSSELFYMYIVNLSANAISLPKHTIIPSETNALSHITQARCHEPEMLDRPKLNNRIHTNEKWVETNDVSPSTRKETNISAEPKCR